MGNQKEELQKLYESGVLTKEEMEAELKKMQVPKNQKTPKSCSSCLLALIGVVAVIVAIVITINLVNNKETTPVNTESPDISALLISNSGSLSDRMTTDGKHLFLFDLGVFTDIDGFSDYAKKKLGGKIQFFICPTKDGTRVAFIKIFPKFLSRAYFNPNKDYGLSQEDMESLDFVGPIIYDLGRKWVTSLDPNDKKTSDWQPSAKYERVWLTPEAEHEKNKLFRYIAMGKISESDGNFYVGGRQLTKEEISDMVKFGMLTKKHWFSKPEIVEDYNRAIDIAESSKRQEGNSILNNQ